MNSPSEVFVIGSLNADLVQHVQRLPKPGETIVGAQLRTFSGGKGANQACAASSMGARAHMIGQLGNDAFASPLLESLHAAGVGTESVGRSDLATGTALILVLPDGENVIVISPGANSTLDPRQAARRLRGLRRGSILLSQLEIPVASVHESLASARARGATTILDPAPARTLAPDLLAHVDFLTPNETETRTLLEDPDLALDSNSDLELAARKILALGPRCSILKIGSRGCFIANEQGSLRVPGFEVRTVDTTAAGDVFNGAFAAALAEGRSVPQAARFANAAAALSVTRPGAQSSVPSRAEVDTFLSAAAA